MAGINTGGSLGSPLEWFQTGRQMAGPNALGVFVQGVLQRYNALLSTRVATQIETRGAIQKEQALFPFRTEQARLEAEAKADAEARLPTQQLAAEKALMFRKAREGGAGMGIAVNPFTGDPIPMPVSGGISGGISGVGGAQQPTLGQDPQATITKIHSSVDPLTGLSRTTFDIGTEAGSEFDARKSALKEEVQHVRKIASSIRRLGIVTRQFQEGAPAVTGIPIAQRAIGKAQAIGARTGIIPNDQLVALLLNRPAEAIILIRDIGEAGNLSESDIERALQAITFEGLTTSERYARMRQFAEFALGGMSPTAKRILLQHEDIRLFIDSFGININLSATDETSGAPVSTGIPGDRGRFLVELTAPARFHGRRLDAGTRMRATSSMFDPTIMKRVRNGRE